MSKEAYEKLYARSEYRIYSPGEQLVPKFLEVARPYPTDTVIDFGAGTGRAAKRISEHCKVIALDFVNAMETDVEFHEQDLREPIEHKARFGFCCDVMEHIAPEDVHLVLGRILAAARNVFFSISTVDDAMGELVGEKLHLTVKPMSWWLAEFERYGALVKWAKQDKDSFILYVTAYLDWNHAQVVTYVHDEENLQSNVRANLEAHYQEVSPHDDQDTPIIVLAGGPSLNDYVADITYLHKVEGLPIVTTNGTYNWALEHGLKPGAQIVMDAREFNRRFVQPVIDNCRYLVCSQCDPRVAELLPREQVWLWHPSHAFDVIKESGFKGEWFPIMGGSTVMLRGLPLLRLLGFRRFHIYGWDSCLRDGEHHAYAQPENEERKVIDITVGPRTYSCHIWMAMQARECQNIIRYMLQDCEMTVYGDGLIAAIIETAAELAAA